MSLSNLTHDELRDHIAADSVEAGDLQARGGGTDKETPPT